MGDKRSNISLLAQFFCVCFVFGFATTYSSRTYIYKMVLPTNQLVTPLVRWMRKAKRKCVIRVSVNGINGSCLFVCLFVRDDVLFYEKRCGTLWVVKYSLNLKVCVTMLRSPGFGIRTTRLSSFLSSLLWPNVFGRFFDWIDVLPPFVYVVLPIDCVFAEYIKFTEAACPLIDFIVLFIVLMTCWLFFSVGMHFAYLLCVIYF